GNSRWPSRPQSNRTHYGPHGINLINSLWPSRPQSDRTQYGPHGLNLIGLSMALTASI
ncbi:hypothetical protein HAX54_049988, partial [Datura stramonium]|nr:hypothetical protein [Datura stramonium]